MARRVMYQCSFCGKSQDKVERLIAGPGGVYICDQCVALCQEIISEGRRPPGECQDTPRAHAHLGRGAPWWRPLLPGRRHVARPSGQPL